MGFEAVGEAVELEMHRTKGAAREKPIHQCRSGRFGAVAQEGNLARDADVGRALSLASSLTEAAVGRVACEVGLVAS